MAFSDGWLTQLPPVFETQAGGLALAAKEVTGHFSPAFPEGVAIKRLPQSILAVRARGKFDAPAVDGFVEPVLALLNHLREENRGRLLLIVDASEVTEIEKGIDLLFAAQAGGKKYQSHPNLLGVIILAPTEGVLTSILGMVATIGGMINGYAPVKVLQKMQLEELQPKIIETMRAMIDTGHTKPQKES
jgi:hypothetical protein